MNKLLAMLTILTITSCAPVMAKEDVIAKCEREASGAALIMSFRQDGVSLRDTLNVLGISDQKKQWIRDAYRKPVVTTEKYKAMLVDKFKNEVMFDCLDREGY